MRDLPLPPAGTRPAKANATGTAAPGHRTPGPRWPRRWQRPTPTGCRTARRARPGDRPAGRRRHPPPGPRGPGYYAQVAPKNPALSVLASFFLPGLGSMINGDVAKGVGILIGYLISCVLVIVLVGIVGVFGFWVWGMVDAAQGARRWNARHGILS